VVRRIHIFRNLRESYGGLFIRHRIASWPGYQQVFEPCSLDRLKERLREVLSLIAQTLTMDRDTKKQIKATSRLQNSSTNDVLLIGNGPSAKSLTSSQVYNFQANGGSIAVLNDFFRSEIAKSIVPDYYFLSDPEYWFPQRKYMTENISSLTAFIKKHLTSVTIVQPARFSPIVNSHSKYIYLDSRTTGGILRRARPDKPWGLPPSVALQAIATLKFLGHKRVFFTGLDSNFVSFFFVDDLNRIYRSPEGMHFYKSGESPNSIMESISTEPIVESFRHIADLYYAHGIFMRDFYWLCRDNCINVGNDHTNDAAPRACLIPNN
jgi:hypothetical protein